MLSEISYGLRLLAEAPWVSLYGNTHRMDIHRIHRLDSDGAPGAALPIYTFEKKESESRVRFSVSIFLISPVEARWPPYRGTEFGTTK